MDRRQRKSREAIFGAFTELLSEKNYSRITVGQIIARADVGRATFYSHFETKDDLLRALCEDLFCHIFDDLSEPRPAHRHLFACESTGSVFVHLLQHLQQNDHNLLQLLSGENNEVFLRCFRQGLQQLVESQLALFAHRKSELLPDSFWIDHISSTFVDTVRWWLHNGRKESAETIAEYFLLAV